MKKLVILLGLLTVLGGGGAAAYAMGLIPGFGPAAKGQDEAELDQPAGVAMYVKLDALTAPVFGEHQVNHHVMLSLSLEVDDIRAKNDVIAVLPRLQDAMLRDLFARPVVYDDGSGHVDLEGLKERMLAVANRIVGPDVVRQVLVVRAARTS